jgi:hypothetical protein
MRAIQMTSSIVLPLWRMRQLGGPHVILSDAAGGAEGCGP